MALLEEWFEDNEALDRLSISARALVWSTLLSLLLERELLQGHVVLAFELITFLQADGYQEPAFSGRQPRLPVQVRTAALLYAYDEDDFVGSAARAVLIFEFEDYSTWPRVVQGARRDEAGDWATLAIALQRGDERARLAISEIERDSSAHELVRQQARDLAEKYP